ncbi:MAG: hypothetical protein LEGION0403_FIIPPAGN_02501 [Legionella sp.]|uniref:hypothetical protein n=1 Tax=Legionella sp. TaxID=459 RepID=UPI003D148CFE
MQTPLEQGINQVTSKTELQLTTAKTKNKKRTNHQPALDVTQSEPSTKKKKAAAPPTTLKTTIATLLHSYTTNLIDFSIFKTEVSKLKQSLQDANIKMDKFIELICPPLNNRHMSQINKVRDREGYLQWTVDEIEEYYTQISQEERLTTDGSNIINNILNCIGYKQLNLLIDKPKIKQQLINNYAYEFISFLQPYLSVVEILDQYFPGELGEQLKTKDIRPEISATFLDWLYSIDPIATFDYWKQGFRPYSQIEFNQHFFSITTEPPQLLAIYREIISDECYSELCLFPSQTSPWRLFLNNSVINLELFQQLIEKTRSRPNLQEIQTEIDRYYHRSDQVHIQKIIYCISLLSEPLNTPANVRFARELKARLPVELQPRAQLPQKSPPQISDEWLQQNLIANATEADTLFFCLSIIILKNRQYDELTKLWDLLKDKQGQPQQLFKSYLLAFQLTNPLLPRNSLAMMVPGAAPMYPFLSISERRNTEQNGRIKIKQTLAHFAAQLSATELSQSIELLINFSTSGLVHLANKHALTALPSTILGYFAQFNAELINIIPDTALLSSQSYYPISRILYTLVVKMEQEKKATTPGSLTSLIDAYTLSENRKKECLGTLFSQIIMHFSVTPNSKGVCQLMDKLTSLEPSWLNYLAQEVHVQGQNRNLFTSYSKLFSSPQLAQHAAEILAYLLEKIRDNEQVILPEQFLKEIAEWQLNLQKKAQLNASTQTILETIYNHCIHKTQNTPQEKTFEEIRTQLLIRFNGDPAQEAQAIHSRENHEFSDLIYSTWMSALGDTEVLRREKITQGKAFFIQLIAQKESEIVEKHLHDKNREFLFKFPSFLLGVRNTGFDAEYQPIIEDIKPYQLVRTYIKQVTARSKQIETPTMNAQQRQRIKDAQKLINLICAITYYAQAEQQAPEPFRINDNQEALNILLIELIDQASNPSCDQGPFMRLLIALEPTAEYRFPFLTRRSIQFYINDYINAFYAQQSAAETKNLLQEIYVKIEDKETLADIDYLPEHSVSFLASRFLEEYASRMGHITAKEIELLFSMERPKVYHPLLVTALNQYYQEQRAVLLNPPALNPNRFFMMHDSREIARSSSIDIDAQLENETPTSPQKSLR